MHETPSLHHKIWAIAWPAILSNISIPLLGLVDAAILGHLDSAQYLGAVAIGGALLSFLYWGFGFLRMGTTGLVAKAMGAGKEDQATLILAQSAILAVGLAIVVLTLHPLWLGAGFALMAPRPELAALADSYVSIRIFSAPAVLVTYAVVGWFIGHQNTRWPMVIVIITNCTNIALDFLLIVGFQLASDGAAIATLIAEYLGCAVALYGVWRNLERRPGPALLAQLKHWAAYRTLLLSNQYLFVRTVCLLASFAFFTAMGSKLGDNVLAANMVLMQLVMLTAYGMDGFAFAAEALTGTSLGARDLRGFYAAVRQCGQWCAATAGLMSLALLVCHPLLFALMTDIPAVAELLPQYRWWLICLPLIAAPSYLLDGVFIGSTESRSMMITMLISAGAVYLPVWYLSQSLGNHGLWLAFTAFSAARGISLYVCYLALTRRDRWLETNKK